MNRDDSEPVDAILIPNAVYQRVAGDHSETERNEAHRWWIEYYKMFD